MPARPRYPGAMPSTTLITGASSGIGAALAREMARRGHRVGLVARREAELRALALEIGEAAAWAVADVADLDALTGAVRSIEAALGPCEVMVANAGIGEVASIRRYDARRFARVMRVNYEGVVNAVGIVLPAMLDRGAGHLVAISSLAGYRGMPASAAYSASKAAVSTLMESLRVDLGGTGIAVTTVHPGFVETPIVAGASFPLPFLVKVDRAARIVADGIERRRAEVNFPWPMATGTALARHLPSWAWVAAARAVSPTKKRPRRQEDT